MTQTRLGSLLESCVNVAVGFGLAFLTNLIVWPMFGIKGVSVHDNLAITTIFTVISIGRSYAFRRWFNARPSGK